MKKRSVTITSLQFFEKLVWLDGKPLLDTIEPYRQRLFTQALDTVGPDGWPIYNMVLAGRGKKNWKSADLVEAALYCSVVRRSVQGGNSLILASDEGQANDDLDLLKKLVEANPLLRSEFDVLAKELKLKDGSGLVRILPTGDAGGLHGKTFGFLGNDEIHTQNDWRVLEALQPDPTRRDALTWITSYDSVTDAEGQPLHDLKKLGMAGTDPRLLFSWYSGDYCTDPDFASLDPEERANPSSASWPEGNGYLEQQRRRLPANIFRRLHLNLPSTAESFISMPSWDACVDPDWREVLHDRSLAVYVGIDAGHKHDSTAIVAVCFDRETKRVKLVFHRVFVPRRGEELDFEATIAATVRMLTQRYRVVQVLFDPWQMQAIAQQLKRERAPIEEFPQTPGNLTAAAQNLFELISARNIVLYENKDMRLAASRAIATEMPRGWRIDKAKQAHRIDVVVALMLACHAAVEGQSAPLHPQFSPGDADYVRARGQMRAMGVYGAEWGGIGERAFYQRQRRMSGGY